METLVRLKHQCRATESIDVTWIDSIIGQPYIEAHRLTQRRWWHICGTCNTSSLEFHGVLLPPPVGWILKELLKTGFTISLIKDEHVTRQQQSVVESTVQIQDHRNPSLKVSLKWYVLRKYAQQPLRFGDSSHYYKMDGRFLLLLPGRVESVFGLLRAKGFRLPIFEQCLCPRNSALGLHAVLENRFVLDYEAIPAKEYDAASAGDTSEVLVVRAEITWPSDLLRYGNEIDKRPLPGTKQRGLRKKASASK